METVKPNGKVFDRSLHCHPAHGRTSQQGLGSSGGAGFEPRGNQDRIPCPLFPTVDTTVRDSRTFHLCRAVSYLNLAVKFPDSTSILFYIKDSLPNGKAGIKEAAHTPQMVWDEMMSQLHGDGKT